MAHRKASSVSCAAVFRRVAASTPIISPVPSSPSIVGVSRQQHAPSSSFLSSPRSTFSPPISRFHCRNFSLYYSTDCYLSPRPSRLLSTTGSRGISSTPRRSDDGSSSSSSAAAAATPEAAGDDKEDDDDDPCPPWQNPLHHNNPDYDGSKIFAEDFAPGEEMPLVPLPPFENDGAGGKVLAPPHVHALADKIVHLNMLEVKELLDRMGDHFGFDDDDGFEDEGGGGEAEAEEVVVEEKVIFDLKLMAFDPKGKIKVIKEVRSMTTLGLKEAKELVEGAPKVVKKDIKKEEAEELKAKLEALGATVEIV